MDDTNIKKLTANTSEHSIARLRSSSVSIQAAINDPRLSASLSDLSQQSQIQTRNSTGAKALFEKRVKRYFYQLTSGCGHEDCNYSLCASNQVAPHFSTEVAAAMAVQLASNYSKLLFCPRIPQEPIINKKLAAFGHSPLTSPNSSPTPSASHSRQNSVLMRGNSNPNLSRSDSTQHFVELDSVPTPFLNSLFSFPSFNSLFAYNGGSVAYEKGNLLSDFLNPLHKTRSRSFKNMQQTESFNPDLELSPWEFPFGDSSLEIGDMSCIPETSIPMPKAEEKIGLKYLSLDLLQIAVAQYQNDSEIDSMFLSNTIYGVFSNIEALSKSFLQTSTKKLSSNENDHHSGLNIPSIEKSYEIILLLNPNSLFQKKLVQATELVLIKLYQIVKQSAALDLSIFRIFLIVILNPLFHESSYQETMVKRLCCVLGRVRSKSNTTWILWLSQLPSRLFISILSIFKNYVVSIGPPGGNGMPEEPFVCAIKSLSNLCTANELNHRTSIIPYSEFYLNDFVSRLNFKEEYKRWRKSLEDNSVTEFSLLNYPFLFDPVAKTRIMHIDAMVKMSLQYEEACVKQALVMHTQRFLDDSNAMKEMEEKMKRSVNPYLVLEIRRSHFVSDVLQQISQRKPDLKKPLKVKFVGGGEEGMDQGGVQKEFFQILMSELLDPAFGMFLYDHDTRYSWINSSSLESNSQFELVGIMLGLALYNGVIITLSFPSLMYKKLLKEKIMLEDIEDSFPGLGKGLRQLLEWTDGDVADVFMRTFEISYEHYGKIIHIPLVANGSEVLVTNANRQEYVKLYTKHLVETSIENQFRAFQLGFYKVCGGRPLAMCRPHELELLICGKETDETEFHKLEEGAAYDDGYSASHSEIKWFWEIVHAMSLPHKRMLLEFVTASDRVPLKGLASLTFVIQRNGPDTDRLPSALTCFGRLLLPEYSSKEKLQERLRTAIENAKGFGLV